MRRANPVIPQAAFTLLELMVATVVLMMLLVLLLSLVSQTSEIWKRSRTRIEAFQSARRAMDNLTQLLEQATLNTYWDYDDPQNPHRYVRQSELHFLVCSAGQDNLPGTAGTGQAVFFQAPANTSADPGYSGLTGLLNAVGFYVQFGSDQLWLPAHVPAQNARSRFSLMQWVESTESLSIYQSPQATWIPTTVTNQAVPVAENIIALLIWPREEVLSDPPVLDSYAYDSRLNSTNDPQPVTANQLPPVLQVALVAIDEDSARRLGSQLRTTVEQCLSGLFQDPPSQTYFSDLQVLEERLLAQSIACRSFVSAIPLREAKWSR